ncbi:putative FMN-dependent luciferase-like monooxygenase [Blastococcus sp. Marseille-P5729]|uniref:putative FMN-dependent luciferase-like monooxygenase n=1 Tax=Blastococcus sp. Marseille-P5729 TaxID=2086582 RepID=UPI000D0F4D34|nr:putative FMN-dependent luciferase-like monooxygenase [Blastococcus sp. Marseille-P5729]
MTTIGFFTRLLDDAEPAERYRLAAEQIQHAERNGFATAWVAQHHFHRDEGGLPSPLVFLAHVGALTSRIRLGTGVICLPMEDAVRTAEDLVVADLLTGGRIDVGVSTGGTPSSFPAFGKDFADRYELSDEALSTLLGAWRGEPINGTENRLYPAGGSLPDRIWQATFSVSGGERAGRAGDGLMLSRTQPRPDDRPDAPLAELQQPIIDAYRAALPQGHRPRIMASRTAFVADTREEALRWAEPGLRSAVASSPRAFPRVSADAPLDELIRLTDTHVGTAADVAESLAADSALAAASEVAFQVHSVDAPHPQILRSIELLAAEVAPALGWGQQREEAAA